MTCNSDLGFAELGFGLADVFGARGLELAEVGFGGGAVFFGGAEGDVGGFEGLIGDCAFGVELAGAFGLAGTLFGECGCTPEVCFGDLDGFGSGRGLGAAEGFFGLLDALLGGAERGPRGGCCGFELGSVAEVALGD